MKIKGDHVRYGSPSQLAKLTGIDASTFSEWTHDSERKMSGRMQQSLALALQIPKTELIGAWDQRRDDAAIARKFQKELDDIITKRDQ